MEQQNKPTLLHAGSTFERFVTF